MSLSIYGNLTQNKYPLRTYREFQMKTITLKVDDSINDKFLWLLKHFSANEIKILEHSDYISDDDYLNSINGMVQSINEARNEPIANGVTLDKLDW